MDRNQIDDIICQILYHDGPDGHVDGHDVITDFICALQKDQECEWRDRYFFIHKIDSQ